MTTIRELTCGALCAAVLALPTGAAAQVSDAWQFGAQLYGYFPSFDGNTNFQAGGGTTVSVDASKLVEDLQFVTPSWPPATSTTTLAPGRRSRSSA